MTLIAVLSLALSGCAVLFPSAEMRAARETPGFKAGFSDGCSAATAASADMSVDKFRDKAMYESDANYRAGWANGWSNCRPAGSITPPNAGPVPDIAPGGKKVGY